jgi:citronellol/citronellal dehydrogenase
MPNLSQKTVLISGGSRGIGLGIALRAARDGAQIALLAKTATPHPRLEGTIYTAAEAIEAHGGRALPLVGDIRDDQFVADAVAETASTFGGVDIVVNNASAIDLRPTEAIDMKRYDLMQDINARGAFLLSKLAVPHLKQAANPHILTLSPPINLDPRWAGAHLGYTISKYAMSLTTLGLSLELARYGIAVNSLWPETFVATAAVQNLLGGDVVAAGSRTPEVMADAAYAVFVRDSRSCTGNFFLDRDVLAAVGITDLERYRHGDGKVPLQRDLFLDGGPTVE